MTTPNTASRHLMSRVELDVLVASGASLAIDFVAAGATASQAFTTMLGRVAERVGGVTVARVDLAESPELGALFGIAEAPALVLFRRGVGLYAGPANFSEAQLEAMLRRALALDMDDVLREMSDDRGAIHSHSNMTCPTVRRGSMPGAST
jgi:thioredoxin 1